MDDVKKSLPPGVTIARGLQADRPRRRRCSKTVERNLFEGAILVIAVLFAFLGNLRAGLIVASAIPLSMLFAVTMMERVGIAGSLMSLGAIDFGLVVDSSVVMVENCVRRLAHDRSDRTKLAIIRDAAVEVRKPTMFGELIIMIVYLPILTLEGIEGKLFRPMALTVIFALAASLVLSLTLMPALASLGLPRRIADKETLVDRLAHRLFQPLLRWGLRHPRVDPRLGRCPDRRRRRCSAYGSGSEFVPRLNEGSMVINTVRLAGVSLEESLRYGIHIERILKKRFPDEIEDIWTQDRECRSGDRPDGPGTFRHLHHARSPATGWKRAKTQEELVSAMAEATKVLPGMRAVYTQPIEMRINEMVAGIRADLGIKLYGDDLETLKAKAEEIERVVKSIPGAADTTTEQMTGPARAPNRGR